MLQHQACTWDYGWGKRWFLPRDWENFIFGACSFSVSVFISGWRPLTLLFLAICFCNTTNQSKELIWPKKINRANNGSRWSQLFSSVVACHVVSSLPYCSTWSQSQPFAETDACPSCNFFFLSFDFFFPWVAGGGCAVQGAEFSHCRGLVLARR